jgi:hypothetical protein
MLHQSHIYLSLVEVTNLKGSQSQMVSTYNQILGKYVAQHLGKISKYTSIYALEVQEQTT